MIEDIACTIHHTPYSMNMNQNQMKRLNLLNQITHNHEPPAHVIYMDK